MSTIPSPDQGAEELADSSKSTQPSEQGSEFTPAQLAKISELMNRTFRGILKRDVIPLIQPKAAPEPQVDEEKATLSQRVEELSKKLRDTEAREREEKIQNHIMSLLSRNDIQSPDIVANQLRSKFTLRDGQVLTLDEYGDPRPGDELVKEFLSQHPHFRPAREIKGTSRGAIPGSGRVPRAPMAEDPYSQSAGSVSVEADQAMIDRLGPVKAKALGLI